MKDHKTGQLSGALVDCDPLQADPILCELRRVDGIPEENYMPMDYQSPSHFSLHPPKYYRHDAEAIFLFWFEFTRRLKGLHYCYGMSENKKLWYWNANGSLAQVSGGSKSVEETLTALWKLIGDAYFLSRMKPRDETLCGHFTVEKLLEAIGVDIQILESTVADEESLKESVSDSD